MTPALQNLISQLRLTNNAVTNSPTEPNQQAFNTVVEQLGQYNFQEEDLVHFQQIVTDKRFRLSLVKNIIRGEWDITSQARRLFGTQLLRATQHAIVCENFMAPTLEAALKDLAPPEDATLDLDLDDGPISLIFENGKQVHITCSEWGTIAQGIYQPKSLTE